MKFSRQHILFLVLIFLIPLTSHSQVRVLSKAPGQITVNLHLSWTEQKIEQDGHTYSYWVANGINGTTISNGFEIPVTSFKIPLPIGSQPSLQVIHRSTLTRPSASLYRVSPRTSTESETQDTSLFQYKGRVSVRGFQLGVFEFHPLQFQQNAVRLTTDATVVVSFPVQSLKSAPPEISEFDQSLLRSITISSDYLQESRLPTGLTKAQMPATVDRRGTWYRIPINQTGIYSISYSWLQSHHIPVDNIDTRKIRVFAAPNYGLPLTTPAGATLDQIGSVLHEIPITVESDDNTLNTGDKIEFFGQAPSRFVIENNSVQFIQNEYDTKNYYWLNLPDATSEATGLRIQQTSLSTGGNILSTAPGYYHFEEDLNNYMSSGRHWFGKILFGTHDTQTFPLDLEGILPDSSSTVKIRVARGNDKSSERFSFAINQADPFTNTYISQGESTNSTNTVTVHFDQSNHPFGTGSNSLEITAEGSSSSAQGLLDYINIQYIRQLTVPGGKGYLQFFSSPMTGVHTFEISGLQSTAQAFDITNPSEITRLRLTTSGDALLFTVDFGNTPQTREFYLAEPEVRQLPSGIDAVESFSHPVLRTVENQTTDYVIITPSVFTEEAQQLAEHRSTHYQHLRSGLNVKVVNTEDIYNEFSGGLQDPTAIRNFLIWAYQNWRNPDGNERLKYVLLFGDADYDFRNISGNSQVFVPTYQNTNMSLYNTMEIEDFFVWVDGNDNANDLALGRLPASSPDEAQAMVDKIINYDTKLPFGQWRNTITMVGDDPFRPRPNEPWHISYLEDSVIPVIPSVFHLRKIYLPDFPIVEDLSSFGVTRPGVTVALLDQLKQGTLAVNFSGHGSPKVWTQERVLTMDRDLPRIETGSKLPLWVAATCEWGRFDMIGDRCMAEGLMTLPHNGAIATISATRLSFLSPNIAFMANFFKNLFSDQENRSYSYPIGVAVMAAKNEMSRTDDNKRRFALLGDPALQLASPEYSADITNLNPDTLSALTRASFQGNTQVSTPQKSAAFTGTGLITVYDTDKHVHHEWPSTHLDYTLPGSRIFYGPVSILNGEFSGNFVVPKDITYGGDNGKISVLYQSSDSTIIGAGIRTQIAYRGTGSGLDDKKGPTIQFGVEGYNFRPGDAVPKDAVLDILLHDENGLNLTGSVGHQLKLMIDGPLTQEYDVTEFFSYDVDSYQQGHIRYPLTGLDPGKYTLTLRAWDTSNNLSVQSSEIRLIEGAQFQVAQVVNYPNPMASSTDFTFTLSAPARVKIRIFTLSGQPVSTLKATYAIPGFQTLHWDGTDQFGARIANGVYLYRVTATAIDSKDTDTFVGKLAVTL